MMFPHTHPELPVGPLSMRLMLDRRLEVRENSRARTASGRS